MWGHQEKYRSSYSPPSFFSAVSPSSTPFQLVTWVRFADALVDAHTLTIVTFTNTGSAPGMIRCTTSRDHDPTWAISHAANEARETPQLSWWTSMNKDSVTWEGGVKMTTQQQGLNYSLKSYLHRQCPQIQCSYRRFSANYHNQSSPKGADSPKEKKFTNRKSTKKEICDGKQKRTKYFFKCLQKDRRKEGRKRKVLFTVLELFKCSVAPPSCRCFCRHQKK